MSVLWGKRVLVVEDEPIIGFALEDILLSLESDHVRIATRVREALDLALHEAFDVAILDVNIHGERSYAVADALEQQGVPFIFATGYGDSVHPARFQTSPTLMKPYSGSDIKRCLSSVLAGRAGPHPRSVPRPGKQAHARSGPEPAMAPGTRPAPVGPQVLE